MLLKLFTTAVTLAASPGTPMPGTAAFQKPEVPWPIGSGLMQFGVKSTSDSYTDGNFSLTAPIFSNIGQSGTLGGSMAFVEPYISWGEQGEVAASLGIGFRHLFNSQPLSALQERHNGPLDEGILIGGNAFLDMLDTTSNNRFWQLGLGLEFETRYFALRGNYYHPLTRRQEGEPYIQRSVQRGELLTSGKEPFATGHTIQQDVTFTTFDFYTDRLYRYYEEGMKGWDIEAAAMVPGLDKWCELWLIAGYGDFQNKPFGPQIGGTREMQGWKAGIEFRPIPQLVLNAMHYEEKRMQGGEWMYGLSLQLPLDPEPANQDKSWWQKLRDTLKPRSRHLAERTAVPVHRQNAAVKLANSISKPEVQQYAKEVSSREARVVVRDDVIFVNNGGAQGNGIAAHGAVEDGTAERPFDTIQEGVGTSATSRFQARGVPTVYVAGPASPVPFLAGLGTYVENVGVTKSVDIYSGLTGVPGFAGEVFGRTTSPAALIGGIMVTGAPFFSVSGLEIVRGILAGSAPDGRGILVLGDAGIIRIVGNRISGTTQAIVIQSSLTTSTTEVLIDGNEIASESGIAIYGGDGSTIYATVQRNSISITSPNHEALLLSVGERKSMFLTFDDNLVLNDSGGIAFGIATLSGSPGGTVFVKSNTENSFVGQVLIPVVNNGGISFGATNLKGYLRINGGLVWFP